MEITIESLIPSEINIVSRLIETEITNSYHFEGVDLSQYPHLVKEEMIEQLFRLDKYLNNFLVAKHNGSIVGTITYIPPTKPLLITQTNMKTQYQSIQELGFLYIDEKFQRQGIGTKLFIAILRKLEREGIINFVVTTGWTKGHNFWLKTLGKETTVLPTYYNGHPCFVWIREVSKYV